MKQQNTRSHYNDQVGQQYAQKSNGIFSPQDWKCSHCDNVNFAFRTTCNLCKKPLQDVRQKSNVRTKDVSERKGRGGGYLELDVEYVEKNKNLSDDEFDDFGRLKPQKRAKIEEIVLEATSTNNHDIDDDLEEDEEDFDESKYEL